MLLWGVSRHGGIDGDQGPFWVHHHDGSVPTQRRQHDFCFLFSVALEHPTSTLTLLWQTTETLSDAIFGSEYLLLFPPVSQL